MPPTICGVFLSGSCNQTNWETTTPGSTTLLLKRQHASEYLALSAYLHLLLPAFLNLPLTDRAVDKPAKVANLKFPCRTILFNLRGALPYHPTAIDLLMRGLLQGQKKQELALSMHGDIPPPLLKTLHGFKGNS